VTRPRLTSPLSLRLAIFDRGDRQYLTINGEDRDVTGWEQVTVTLVRREGGGLGALVSLERGGDVQVWPVESVEAVG
jgi:hypothetical protein